MMGRNVDFALNVGASMHTIKWSERKLRHFEQISAARRADLSSKESFDP